MSHAIRMLIGCLVPLALIFLLPLLGFDSGVSLFIFIILMFACHLFMLGGHRHGVHGRRGEPSSEHQHPAAENKKGISHE